MSKVVSKVRLLAVLLVAFSLVLAGCGVQSPTPPASPGSAQPSGAAQPASPPIKLVLAHVFPAESLEHKTAQQFKTQLAQETNGNIQVEIFPASQLGGFQEILQQLKSGAAHVQFISTTALGGVADVATVDSWPFMFDTKAQFDKAYASGVGKEFIAAIETKSGYRVVGPTYKGLRQIYVNKPVKNATDLKGLKIRVPGLNMVVDAFKAWEMAPTPMAVAEIFPSMQQNVVNGVEIEVPTAVSMGLPEVTKSVVLTSHMMPNYAWIFWGQYLDGLPSEQKAAIEKAARDASAWFTEQLLKEEDAALERFKAAGAQVVTIDASAMRKAVQEVLAAKYPELAGWASRLREAGQ